MEKPKHQVSLPELVTHLISTKNTKPEEETERLEDAQEQSMSTQPKVAAVAPRNPNKDADTQECKDGRNVTEWDDSPIRKQIQIPMLEQPAGEGLLSMTQGV